MYMLNWHTLMQFAKGLPFIRRLIFYFTFSPHYEMHLDCTTLEQQHFMLLRDHEGEFLGRQVWITYLTLPERVYSQHFPIYVGRFEDMQLLSRKLREITNRNKDVGMKYKAIIAI